MNVMNLSNNELQQRYTSMALDLAEPMIETTSQDLIEFALIESEMDARGFLINTSPYDILRFRNDNTATIDNWEQELRGELDFYGYTITNEGETLLQNLRNSYPDGEISTFYDWAEVTMEAFVGPSPYYSPGQQSNNNGVQGAPRTLGILSGTLGGATTSTSTSSAHGAMRAHTSQMNQDPRADLYEY